MMKFMQREKGAISIFLAIILLPMMAIASIYIDASRVKLAKSLVSSAGDLTLNTALTNYDNVLKDMYGVFAMSQSETELFENLEDYYRKSLVSSGLTEEDANTYVGKIMAQLGVIGETGEVGDLLRIELVNEDGNGILETDEKRSLANPYMLKKQMVEFMKYRFAIGVGMSFISSLQSFKGLSEQMEVFDAREDYYEKQRNVIESCEAAWKAIYQYNENNLTMKEFEELEKETKSSVDNYLYITQNYVKDYYNAVDRGGSGKEYFTLESMIQLVKENTGFTLYIDNKKYTDFGSYTDEKPATGEKLESLKNDLTSAATKYKGVRDSADYAEVFVTGNGAGIYEVQRVIQFNRLSENEDSLGQIMKRYHIAYQSLIKAVESINNSITFYTKKLETANKEYQQLNTDITVNEATILLDRGLIASNDESIESIKSSIKKLKESAEYKKNPKNYEDTIKSYQEEIENYEESNDSLKEEIEDLKGEIDNIKNNLLPAKQEEIDIYKETLAELKRISTTPVSYFNTTKTYNDIITAQKTNYDKVASEYAEVIKRMKETIAKEKVSKEFIHGANATDSNKGWVAGTLSDTELQRISTYLTGVYSKLKIGSEYLDASSKHLQDVIVSLSPGGELYTSQEAWEGKANNTNIEGTVVAGQNQDELASVREFMEKDQVQTLKDRIDQTKQTVDAMIADIEACTYAGGMIKDIKGMQSLMETIGAYTEKEFDFIKIDLKESKLDTFSKQVYEAYIKTNPGILTTGWMKDTVTWEKSYSPILKTGDECAFFKYLEKNFPEPTSEKASSVKDTDVNSGGVDNVNDTFENTKDDMENIADKMESAPQNNMTLTDNSPSRYWETTLKNQVESAGGGAELPSGDEGFLKTLCSEIVKLIGDFTTDFRDNIYISDYILSMFSYDTFEKEIIYNLNEEDGSNTSNKLNYVLQNTFKGSVYEKAEGDSYTLSSSVTKPDEYLKRATTLTKVAISPQNNAAYLSEVEYILYGENNASAKTYGTIMGIRTAFNTIYAFTDSEIREGAYSIALAVFGVPPLTFLVPIAQGAIIIAVALAESAIDLAMLKAGMKVPLFKTSSSWVLKFSTLMSQLTGAAIDWAATEVTELVNQAVDTATSKLNEWLDKTDEEITQLIEAGSNEVLYLVDYVEDSIDESIDRYTDAVVNQLVTIVQTANNLVNSEDMIISSEFPDGVILQEYVFIKLEQWLDGEDSGVANDLGYIAKEAAVHYILRNSKIVNDIIQLVENASNKVSENVLQVASAMHEEIQRIRNNICTNIKESVDKITSYKQQVVTNIQKSLASNGEKLKDTINEVVNGTANKLKEGVGGIGEDISFNKDSNSTASFFSFSYSDYLRLFLVVSLTMNQEKVLLRTADVMESNMKLKGDSFLMKNAYTYAQINVICKVKPLMMTLPFMEHFSEGKLSGDGWYTIEYKDLMGY